MMTSHHHSRSSRSSMIERLPMIPRGGAAIASSKKDEDNKRSLPRAVAQWWYARIPSMGRYFVSGNLGNVVLYLLERFLAVVLLYVLPDKNNGGDATAGSNDSNHRDSLSFFAAYWLHIPAQHYLHALLVYGLASINTPQKYWTTLAGMSSTLLVASVGSTALNAVLRQQLGIPKTWAFVLTLYSFSIVNYFVIGYIVKRSAAAADKKEQRQSSNTSRSRRIPTDPSLLHGGGAAAEPSVVVRKNGRKQPKRSKINPSRIVDHHPDDATQRNSNNTSAAASANADSSR